MTIPAARHFPFFDEPELAVGKKSPAVRHGHGIPAAGKRKLPDYYRILLQMQYQRELEAEQRRRSSVPQAKEKINALLEIDAMDLDRVQAIVLEI